MVIVSRGALGYETPGYTIRLGYEMSGSQSNTSCKHIQPLSRIILLPEIKH